MCAGGACGGHAPQGRHLPGPSPPLVCRLRAGDGGAGVPPPVQSPGGGHRRGPHRSPFLPSTFHCPTSFDDIVRVVHDMALDPTRKLMRMRLLRHVPSPFPPPHHPHPPLLSTFPAIFIFFFPQRIDMHCAYSQNVGPSCHADLRWLRSILSD